MTSHEEADMPTLDDLTLHIVETTASAGARYRGTVIARTVAYIVAQRALTREARLLATARHAIVRKVVRDVVRPLIPLIREGMFTGAAGGVGTIGGDGRSAGGAGPFSGAAGGAGTIGGAGARLAWMNGGGAPSGLGGSIGVGFSREDVVVESEFGVYECLFGHRTIAQPRDGRLPCPVCAESGRTVAVLRTRRPPAG